MKSQTAMVVNAELIELLTFIRDEINAKLDELAASEEDRDRYDELGDEDEEIGR